MAGVTLRLINSLNLEVAQTISDGFGRYIFENLDSGDYQVKFDLPVGYTFTTQNYVSDNLDSDINSGTGYSDSYSLLPGDRNLSVDAGLLATGLASIGDTVWLDVNADGIQNVTEQGIAGITVNLYGDSNQLIASVQTDVNGHYQFQGLQPGDYYLVFAPAAAYGLLTDQIRAGIIKMIPMPILALVKLQLSL